MGKAEERLTFSEISLYLAYNEHTGEITWIGNSAIRNRIGNKAGRVQTQGYIIITLKGCNIRAHRLAYLLKTGEWPKGQIDHINRIRSDNRWTNLRLASHSENTRNSAMPCTNTSGFKGVSKCYSKWRAFISVDGKRILIGSYYSKEDAAKAYDAAAKFYHKDFAPALLPAAVIAPETGKETR